jgi:hypothetical protein
LGRKDWKRIGKRRTELKIYWEEEEERNRRRERGERREEKGRR